MGIGCCLTRGTGPSGDLTGRFERMGCHEHQVLLGEIDSKPTNFRGANVTSLIVVGCPKVLTGSGMGYGKRKTKEHGTTCTFVDCCRMFTVRWKSSMLSIF